LQWDYLEEKNKKDLLMHHLVMATPAHILLATRARALLGMEGNLLTQVGDKEHMQPLQEHTLLQREL
jgi:hypothetical protein